MVQRHEVILQQRGRHWRLGTWPGGDGRVDVRGTIGGATLTLQVVNGCAARLEHTVGTDTTFTATGSNGFKLEAGSQIRWLSPGSPSALYVSAYRI